jgi:hypothetical protein
MATIHINRREYHTQASELTGEQILALAGIGTDHDLFFLQGEGDRSGGTPIALTEPFPIRDGEHFRAIPGDRNFG